MPVCVQIRFQAEGLVFERSESKTYNPSKMLHIRENKIKKMRYRTKRMLRLFFERAIRIFEENTFADNDLNRRRLKAYC